MGACEFCRGLDSVIPDNEEVSTPQCKHHPHDSFPAAPVPYREASFGSSRIADVCNRGVEQISAPANLSEL